VKEFSLFFNNKNKKLGSAKVHHDLKEWIHNVLELAAM
jgi:hypothetical protein